MKIFDEDGLLKFSNLEKSYYYLSNDLTEIYDNVKNSTDEKDLIIKDLLHRIAKSSFASHCACSR